MNISMGFTHDYEVELNHQLSGREVEKVFYFPGASIRGGKDGLLLKIKPKNGEVWFGVFGSVYGPESMAAAGVYSCPNENFLCVMYAGSVYMGPVNAPVAWTMIAQYTNQVIQAIEENLILFVSHYDIIAYGINGKIWKTIQIGFGDELKVTQVKNGLIYGEFYDPINRNKPIVNFIVDIKTGAIQ